MALVKEREAMIEQLRSFVGEVGTVEVEFDAMVGKIPTKKSMYEYYGKGGGDKSLLVMEEVYKAEFVDGKYWQMYINRSGAWIKT